MLNTKVSPQTQLVRFYFSASVAAKHTLASSHRQESQLSVTLA
jgi:hypothetical protein